MVGHSVIHGKAPPVSDIDIIWIFPYYTRSLLPCQYIFQTFLRIFLDYFASPPHFARFFSILLEFRFCGMVSIGETGGSSQPVRAWTLPASQIWPTLRQDIQRFFLFLSPRRSVIALLMFLRHLPPWPARAMAHQIDVKKVNSHFYRVSENDFYVLYIFIKHLMHFSSLYCAQVISA